MLHLNPYLSCFLSDVTIFFNAAFRGSNWVSKCHACLLNSSVVTNPYVPCNPFNSSTSIIHCTAAQRLHMIHFEVSPSITQPNPLLCNSPGVWAIRSRQCCLASSTKEFSWAQMLSSFIVFSPICHTSTSVWPEKWAGLNNLGWGKELSYWSPESGCFKVLP